MKELFELPEIEIVSIPTEDIIQTSGIDADGRPWEEDI